MTLTAADLQRSIVFYTTHVGFQLLLNFEPNCVLLSNGTVILVLGQPYSPEEAVAEGVFIENRVGLDHLSFSVANHQALEAAAA